MWSGVPRSRKHALAAAALIIIIKIIKVNTGGHTQLGYKYLHKYLLCNIYADINIYSLISVHQRSHKSHKGYNQLWISNMQYWICSSISGVFQCTKSPHNLQIVPVTEKTILAAAASCLVSSFSHLLTCTSLRGTRHDIGKCSSSPSRAILLLLVIQCSCIVQCPCYVQSQLLFI